ncbi:hypothetical protein CERZMDRAFT_90261 [Cercospora zeae-maydis SCOH1-5]|uniref:Uncharacterized protein n=1 Tax=Cercospora zeae-maydis SCOH1-5 TaxID=717836 RepID=A0A6A6FP59_9PEZI|nr:hypothetical protein CERZMDRAFT_90261 [Cercospora zeae-maydis SCOH1-5]
MSSLLDRFELRMLLHTARNPSHSNSWSRVGSQQTPMRQAYLHEGVVGAFDKFHEATLLNAHEVDAITSS